MASRFRRQRCSATARDNSRCGRMCADGAVLCSIHDPARKPAGIIAQQDTDDLGELLKRLTKDRDPAIRLRAIEARLKWQERQDQRCPRCEAATAKAADFTEMLLGMDPYERERVRDALAVLRDVKRDIRLRLGMDTPLIAPVPATAEPDEPSVSPDTFVDEPEPITDVDPVYEQVPEED